MQGLNLKARSFFLVDVPVKKSWENFKAYSVLICEPKGFTAAQK